ncbi:hypothetical protein AKJ40_01660 [candidate division MSBL1 archaeon SCGC-AAA259M10]|uniref:DNA/RNA-binding protein Alba-like domain-containing protein n=1 Tax=candidate division MSBL1 archaeon SCGC-AAA259M10 TaxID=1698270 RepID=A0A133V1A2_9EURY|nr:hypothetical protein AKJ40_01660 [candidate division MSBL1 archaeon SCGC-AAA259M10]
MEEIRIGEKSKGEYISAVLWAFRNSHDSVVVAGLGTRISKSFDIVGEVVETLDNVEKKNSETFEKEGVPGIRITLSKREVEK